MLEVLQKLNDYLWEIPKTFRKDMRVPARIYATEKMLADITSDRSLNQLVNTTAIPGIQKYALAMPDVHEGYGVPVGGIFASLYPDGAVSPGAIGYDINCGVRLLKSEQSHKQVKPYLVELAKTLYRQVPSGVGQGGRLKLKIKELEKVLKTGAEWMINNGYGEGEDLNCIESYGKLEQADPETVSKHAKKRGRDQLGTMGAGNHFVEIDRVETIFNKQTARAFGLRQDQIVILIHCGSRGLGHQVATDYIKLMLSAMPRYKIKLPDRELACAPFSSPQGARYFSAMSAAANFAWANRQLITWEIRQAWRKVLGQVAGSLSILYDVAHNIAKLEEYEIEGKMKKLIVHRKGSTRAFWAGHPELAKNYRACGQPVLIPGSMGTASYVLVGVETNKEQSFGSTCHGAGRRMSRHRAKRSVRGGELRDRLEKQNIHIQAGSLSGLAEEAPLAYKDIDQVVEVVHQAGLARKVARLRPVAVIKA